MTINGPARQPPTGHGKFVHCGPNAWAAGSTFQRAAVCAYGILPRITRCVEGPAHQLHDARMEDGMRVNIYAEEMTDRVEIIEKTTPDGTFTGLRFYLELPVNLTAAQLGRDIPVDENTHFAKGPFIHKTGDDDSAAVTFWGKQDLRETLRTALALLDEHYDRR